MKQKQLSLGLASLIAALFFYLVDMGRLTFFGASTTVSVYPAAFFFLLGLVLIGRTMMAMRE